MKNVYEVIRQKEIQLHQLEEEIEALKLAAKLLTDEKDKRSRRGESISQAEMIRVVLLGSSGPLHVSIIGEAIQKKYKKKIKPAHLSAVIHGHIKKGRLFYKVKDKPNTFGLSEKHLAQTPILKAVGGSN